MDYFSVDLEKTRIFEDGHGYPCFYMPKHPLARQNGTVAVQRHIMSVQIGRWLNEDEIIWFVNKNRKDVRPENLRIVTRTQFLEMMVPDSERVELTCRYCGKHFTVNGGSAKRRFHCSNKCKSMASRQFEIEPEELEKLVWEMPTIHVAALLGVSDKAIEKRCKKFGIRKPPRGYWQKVNAGDWELEKSERPYRQEI
ncbi:MAG: HNH endonuclease [Anaerolineales bacterium]|nr:HNH endonuclease [Anaerolineales bacterium]